MGLGPSDFPIENQVYQVDQVLKDQKYIEKRNFADFAGFGQSMGMGPSDFSIEIMVFQLH